MNEALVNEIMESPHKIGLLCGKDKGTEVHSYGMKHLWRTSGHKALQAHRGFYKTTYFTEMGCIDCLLFNPDVRIALIRKPYTEAAKTLNAIKRYFELESIQQLFYEVHGEYPKPVQKKENSLVFNFKKTITKEGSIDAYGVGGQITGNHYDVIICDDFVVLNDRLSKAEREKTKQFITEIMTNVIDPGKKCIFVGTPWHKDDAWHMKGMPEPIKYDVYQSGILSPQEIQAKRDTTSSELFAINYELKHTAPANLEFAHPQFERWDWQGSNIMGHIDAGFDGECTGALTICAQRRDGKVQARGEVFLENVKDRINWIADTCRKYRVQEVLVENNPDKGYTADLLRKQGLRVFGYHEDMNKHYKITSHVKEHWHNLVFNSDIEHTDYMAQVQEYAQGVKPDDAIDSLASVLRLRFSTKKDWRKLYEW